MDANASSRVRRRRGAARVTLGDVAGRANVSPSTVSLFLRKPDAVSTATGREIAEAIDALGYVPNLVAGGLAAGSSRVVSIIVPSIRNAFFAETVSTIQAELAAEGLQVLLGHTEYDDAAEEALVRTALSWAPAAIVLTGLGHPPAIARLLAGMAAPVIEMWELGADPIDMAVGFDHGEVGRSAARHLLARGATRLAFVGARMSEDRRARQRAGGFAEVCAGAGAACEVLDHAGPASVEAGAILLGRALGRPDRPAAIGCSNDLIALGAIFEAQRRGVTIPDDLQVVGFGDLEFSGSCIPSLTTVRPSGGLIGREVARLIKESLHGVRPARGTVVDVGHVLVERRTT